MIEINNLDQLHSLGVELQRRAEEASKAISTKDRTVPLGASIVQLGGGTILISGGPNDPIATHRADAITIIDREGEVA